MNGTQSSTARTALKFVLMVGIVSFFYSVQGLHCEDPERKSLLMDIGIEELSHLEVVGTIARMHLKPSKHDRNAAQADPLIVIYGGAGAALYNSQGDPWTADYPQNYG